MRTGVPKPSEQATVSSSQVVVKSETDLDGRGILSSGDSTLLVVANGGFNLGLSQTHLVRKGVMRLPLGTSHGGRLLKHLVDLLQTQTLGLRNDEVGEQDTQEEGTAPDKKDFNTQVCLILVNHVWSDNCNDTVPKPVRGGCESHTLGADGKRVDFTDDNPSSRAPGCSKCRDVEASENDETDAPNIEGRISIGSHKDSCRRLLTQHGFLPW